MAFFDSGKPSPSPSSPDSPSASLAAELLNAVQAKRRSKTPLNTDRWSAQLDRLLDRRPVDEVRQVMRWTVAHLRAPGVPLIASAGTFRREYDRLKELMERDPANVQIGEKAQKLTAVLLRDFSWPSGADQDLPRVVQRCLDNYTPFLAKFKAGHDRIKAHVDRVRQTLKAGDLQRTRPERVLRFMNHLVEHERFDPPGIYVLQWLEYLHAKTVRWHEWDGRINHFVWHVHHDRFVRLARGWAYEYHGNSRLWEWTLAYLDGDTTYTDGGKLP